MKINVFYIITVVYFFLNSVFLPLGLLYTSVLAPFFYVWLAFETRARFVVGFILLISPFVAAHLLSGVIIEDYIISLLLLFTVYIFVYTVYWFLETRSYVAIIFDKLTLLNFVFTVFAVLSLFTPYNDLWAWHAISANITGVPRLRLLTYEPSYYSTLLVPLLFYYFLNFINYKKKRDLKYLFLLLIPMLLSFSLGVMAAMVIAILLVVFFSLGIIRIKRTTLYILYLFFTLCVVGAFLLLLFYPENPLYLRIQNILAGTDSSGRGRTFEAVEIALLLLAKQDTWAWGIGLGQIKTVGYDLIVDYYNYSREIVKSVAIPNAFAETLAMFGIVGASVRILLQVILFYKTKVYKNYYQSLCFCFIFLYQFTGSYITNVSEYMLWLFAFIPYFTQFNTRKSTETL